MEEFKKDNEKFFCEVPSNPTRDYSESESTPFGLCQYRGKPHRGYKPALML